MAAPTASSGRGGRAPGSRASARSAPYALGVGLCCALLLAFFGTTGNRNTMTSTPAGAPPGGTAVRRVQGPGHGAARGHPEPTPAAAPAPPLVPRPGKAKEAPFYTRAQLEEMKPVERRLLGRLVDCEGPGRLGNQYFRVAFCVLHIARYGGVMLASQMFNVRPLRGWVAMTDLTVQQAVAHQEEKKWGLATDHYNSYFQNSAFYADERPYLQSVFAVQPVPPTLAPMINNTRSITIHFRVFEVHGERKGPGPVRYFIGVVSELRSRGFDGPIVVATEPALRTHSILEEMVREFGKVHLTGLKNPLADLNALRSAKGALLLSWGTFSWWGAYLNSDAREVHVPFTRNATKTRILPWTDLLVDDDRYQYHDVDDPHPALSYNNLVASDTPFGVCARQSIDKHQGVGRDVRWAINPCRDSLVNGDQSWVRDHPYAKGFFKPNVLKTTSD